MHYGIFGVCQNPCRSKQIVVVSVVEQTKRTHSLDSGEAVYFPDVTMDCLRDYAKKRISEKGLKEGALSLCF